jgi:hypothetical protein
VTRGVRRVALIGLIGMVAATGASATDLHAYWDDRCKGCHGDAGPFARSTLAVREGRLVGRHHVEDLPRFLHQHVLADDLVAPVTAMLTAQVTTPPVYAARCASCHGVAAAFARASLDLRDGVPVARRSGRTLQAVLQGHGGLSAEEQRVVVDTLARVRREVGG